MKLSQRVYGLLLKLYPEEHRREYGELMATHFQDRLREARTSGALLRLWLHTLLDIAQSAPREHAEAAGMQNVTPWPIVLLAIMPGALPFLLSPTADSSERLLLLALGAVYLGILLLSLKRKSAVGWMLPVLGLTGTFAALWALYMLLDDRLLFGQMMAALIFGAALAVAPALREYGGRRTVVLCGCFLATFVAGLAWNGTGAAWRHGEGLAAAAVMVLAIALGLPFARRYGLLGALFVAGSAHWAVQMALEPSLLIRFGAWPQILVLLNFTTVITIIPLLALRAGSARGRVGALLGPLVVYLLLLVVLPPLVYTLSLPPNATAGAGVFLQQVVGRAIYAAQILAGMAFALSLYDDRKAAGALQALGQRRHPA